MESDFPPLPSSGHLSKHSANSSQKRDSVATPTNFTSDYRGIEVAQNGSKIIHKIISRDGDAVLEYIDTDSQKNVTHHRWQVSSDRLIETSPFFSALLDPNKFSEGRRFVESKCRASTTPTLDIGCNDISAEESTERLPLVGLNLFRLMGKHRIESLELFLKVLLSAHDVDLISKMESEIARQPVPVIAGLIEVADVFSSSDMVSVSLEHANYRPSIKGIPSLEVFSSSLLKLSDERLRQIIYIAMFIQHDTIFRVASHALVLIGSVRWLDGGIGLNKSGRHRWSYFDNGLEDLQAHFLRAYGALENDAEHKRPQPKHNMLMTAVLSTSRPFQCRWGFDNSKACDSFHLGEMVRFFTMRSKTIFVGSTLIDPGYENGSEEEDDDNDDDNEDEEKSHVRTSVAHEKTRPYDEAVDRTAGVASTDILSITSSLRQIPDYQIDINHTGCGIRRRLLPLLDCIDGFIGHRRAFVGVTDVMMWKSSTRGSQRKANLDSWRSSGVSRAEKVDVRGAKIMGIRKSSPRSYIDIINTSKSSVALDKNGTTVAPSTTSPVNIIQQQREEARLFFTAKKRNWES
ncbi:conserved hypothetical protein [Talaromyces stipitatus ATCC 10500]|uniref:Uncharacterized protein n=1 Tax=Talaromyces stipitatus (strain ATCC 10500 / CBS 375.48 / QM 6759 / NRRL 1006) TaxID=441959 RepID=B8M1Z1_TALSN|nr:uncharacterized protein TSTA_086000 [Talaromyces stipitatus ATCC 10500]EED21369.1 conserved hypothetical protein [Talaromyces stipitatus ATCC 10500]